MLKKLKFEVDKVNLLDISDDQLAILEIWVCHDGNNLNDEPIDPQALKDAAPTLLNKFLVASFDGADFEGHEKSELILGFFPKENNLQFVEQNGHTYLVAQAILSKVYATWAYDVFVNSNNHRAVSMEISVVDTEKRDDGLEWITAFVFNGVTVLGDTVQEACVGSKAEIVKFSVKDGETAYRKYMDTQSKYKDINFSIPDNVKNEIKSQSDVTSVCKSNFDYLINNTDITPDKLIGMYKYFTKYASDIRFNTGIEWMRSLIDKINLADSDKGGAEKVKKEFAKEEIGSGDYTITVDKSKDSVSDTPWGDVDKTALMHKVLKAKNAETVVKDVYAKVEDGWEDAPSQKLGYPIMSISESKAVYNKGGLLAAEQRAKGTGSDSDIATKVHGIREKLGLVDDPTNGGEKKMDKKDKVAKMTAMCDGKKFSKGEKELCKYCYIDSDEQFMYCYDNESSKLAAVPYSVDGEDVKCDFEKAKMAKVHCAASDDETDDDVCMSLKSVFTSDANTEAVAAAKMNDMKADYDKKLADMSKELETTKVEMAKVKDENDKLKQEKAEKEKAEMSAKVEYTMKSLFATIPQGKEEQVNALKEEGKAMAPDKFSVWENKVKAFAFDCGVSQKETPDFIMDTAWDKPKNKNTSSWDWE